MSTFLQYMHTQMVDRLLTIQGRGEFRPRQTRQLPRAADLKGRLLS